ESLKELEDPKLPKQLDLYDGDDLVGRVSTRHQDDAGEDGGSRPALPDRSILTLRQRYNDAVQALTAENLRNLREWPARLKSITDETTEYQVRNRAIKVENYRESLSHQKIPKIAAPTYKSWGEL